MRPAPALSLIPQPRPVHSLGAFMTFVTLDRINLSHNMPTRNQWLWNFTPKLINYLLLFCFSDYFLSFFLVVVLPFAQTS